MTQNSPWLIALGAGRWHLPGICAARIGPAAALKTLEVMDRIRSWETITAIGKTITQLWHDLGKQNGLSLQTRGLPSLTSFGFPGPNELAYKTFISQEMLNKGILFSNNMYTSIEHTPAVIDRYFTELAPIFALIRQCEDGRDIITLLEGPICQSGFKRLN
jgi:glutamate-1-semialdehyde 2,1-aminomutase